MNTVKVRRVGNSNVVSLPRDLEKLGFREGVSVAILPMRNGKLLLIPADQLDTYVDEVGQRIVEENRSALNALAAYDTGEVEVGAS
jgi:antitoxin component of MazEF toxin-antitoxin module